MRRRKFIEILASLPLASTVMKLNALQHLTELPATERMPVLFLGHGSPMNAIEDNEFSKGWREMGRSLPKPQVVLCVSAHWETRGTFVTAMEKPKTIHDFGGFPQALFDVQYPAPGSPEWAIETKKTITGTEVGLDEKWGLDHGCWSVLKHMYPDADVPVLQLSLDYSQPASYHYALARQLSVLRNKGVLIVGSGNMVHNLRMVAWDKMDAPEYGYDWALQAGETMKSRILDNDFSALVNYTTLGKEVQLAVPTPEHYLPLLYTLALKEAKDDLGLFNDKTLMGSIAMTSIKIG